MEINSNGCFPRRFENIWNNFHFFDKSGFRMEEFCVGAQLQIRATRLGKKSVPKQHVLSKRGYVKLKRKSVGRFPEIFSNPATLCDCKHSNIFYSWFFRSNMWNPILASQKIEAWYSGTMSLHCLMMSRAAFSIATPGMEVWLNIELKSQIYIRI